MSLFYRIASFGNPRGPWRPTQRRAEADAAELGLGDYDEWGKFFVDAGSEIEWIHEYALKKLDEARLSLCTKTPGLESSPARRRA